MCARAGGERAGALARASGPPPERPARAAAAEAGLAAEPRALGGVRRGLPAPGRLFWFHARQQRLAQWIQPPPPVVAADEAWRGRARDAAVTNVAVVTIATQPSHELALLQASCPHALRVLGAGQRYEKYRSKVTLLFDELMCAPLARGPLLAARPGALRWQREAPEQHRCLNAPVFRAARGAACAGPPGGRAAPCPARPLCCFSARARAPATLAAAPAQPCSAGDGCDPSSGSPC